MDKEKALKKEIVIRIPNTGLYYLVLKRIYDCKISKDKNEIIPMKKVTTKITSSLQIKKPKCFELLLFLQDMSLIKVIFGHGISLNYDIHEDEIKI